LGRKVFRFADENSLAQIVELPLPMGKKYWFCPKGPTMNNGQWTMDNSFLIELKNKAKEAGVVFLRIEPSDKHDPAGSCLSVRSINPSGTSIVDLSKTEDELLAAMHSKTRYNIRVAEKHCVVVGQWTMDNGQLFQKVFQLFEETAKRDGFRLHPRGYYEKQIKMPGIEVYGAECEGKLLAAAIVIFSGSTATYLHGASSNEMRNVMAPYALHWAIMKRAKERGMKHYDLWGISDDHKSGWAGITRFKRGWGGTDVFSPGTFDLPVNKFWYSVYTLVRRMRP
jgi:lipid II:glycine glycyltransferase (peptidoglycan interpeptide bridge formation enzyme)